MRNKRILIFTSYRFSERLCIYSIKKIKKLKFNYKYIVISYSNLLINFFIDI